MAGNKIENCVYGLKGSAGWQADYPVTFNKLVTFTGGTSGAGGGGATTITDNTANALAVGQNGTTNPAFNVDASTASSATGVSVKSAAATGGVALNVVSSGTNEDFNINAKGTGSVKFNNATLTVTTSGAVTSASTIAARSTSGLSAGGAIQIGFTNVAAFGIVAGSGAPTFSAAQGSIYLRSDGSSTSTRAYISLGAGSWTAITTAS